MAVFSQMFAMNVHVYVRNERRGGFTRISNNDVMEATATVHINYVGNGHYDVLIPTGALVPDRG